MTHSRDLCGKEAGLWEPVLFRSFWIDQATI